MSSLPPVLDGTAMCAVHPEALSAFTCIRCGSFGCDGCRSTSESVHCEPCRTRLRLGSAIENASAVKLLQDTFRVYVDNLPAVGVLAVLAACVHLLLILTTALPVWARTLLVFGNLIQSLAVFVGFLHWVNQSVQTGGARPSVRLALHAARTRCLSLLLMSLLSGLVVFATGLVCFLPGIYLLFRFVLSPVSLVVGGQGPFASLQDSYARTQGNLLPLLGLFIPLVGGVFVVYAVAGLLGLLLLPLGTAGSTLGSLVQVVMNEGAWCMFGVAMVLAYHRLRAKKKFTAQVQPQ